MHNIQKKNKKRITTLIIMAQGTGVVANLVFWQILN